MELRNMIIKLGIEKKLIYLLKLNQKVYKEVYLLKSNNNILQKGVNKKY